MIFHNPYGTDQTQVRAMIDEGDLDRWDERIVQLHAYWSEKKRLRGRLPGRQDIDPLDLKGLLRWIWLLDVERTPSLRFRFRLLGTAHVQAMGRDVTGRYLDEAFPEINNSASLEDYVSVARSGKASYRYGAAQYHVPEYRMIERLMLPLAGDGETVDMILAITVYHDRVESAAFTIPDYFAKF